MKRSELYAMVWQKPMTKVAEELGLSDVGLAKACRRNDIPVPPRGHWAKVSAGQHPESIGLSYSEVDREIALPSLSARDSGNSAAKEAARKLPLPELDARVIAATHLSATLNSPHPLVRLTAAYCRRIPKLIASYERTPAIDRLMRDVEYPPPEQHGRYTLVAPGCLNLTASLATMDWVLRFHDALLKSLTLAGAKFVIVPADKKHGERVAAELVGERLFVSFRQSYRRVEIDPKELAKLRAEQGWASAWRHEPSEKFSLQLIGTEYESHADFTGTDQQLEARLPEIVGRCLHLLRTQPAIKQARLESEAAARTKAERDARARRMAEARAEQLKNAFELAQTHERVEALKRFLDGFEKDLGNLVEPYSERGKVWLEVVRAELDRTNPYVRLLGKCLSPDPWREWPPSWWPEANIEAE